MPATGTIHDTAPRPMTRSVRHHAFATFSSPGTPQRRGCDDEFRPYECVGGKIVPADGTGTDPQERLAQFEAEVQRREQEAYDKGYREGQAAGHEAGVQELAPVLERFRLSISEVEKFRKAIYCDAEQETVALALALATKIVGHEVGVHSEAILHTVRQALQKVVARERIRIKLNPADLPTVQNNLQAYSDQVEDLQSISFEADERITRGGCVIETNYGDIDAKIESQLEAVTRSLRLALDQSPHRR